MQNKRILIIDDEEDFLSALEKVLTENGYEVVKAADGENGLAMVKSEDPDLVICDVMMPKISGHDVLKLIRQEISGDVPVIMLTAVDDFKSVEKAYEREANFYICKPVDFDTLLKNVRILLSISGTRRGDADAREGADG